MQQVYAKQLEDNPSLFASAPIYHIIPVENTITFAGEYRYYDLTVAPAGVDISEDRDDLEESLDMSGWAASPYIAFQAKRFGVGFTGEMGKRQIRYLRAYDSEKGYAEHLGEAQYSGVGLNAFWTAKLSFLPSYVKPSFVIGGKALNVVEQSSGEVTEPFSDVEMAKYQYRVMNYVAGGNVGIKLVRRFTVTPWVDYSAYQFTTPKSSSGDGATDQSVTDDAVLLWQSAPPLNYGIDFAVELGSFNIRLGGLLGVLGTLNKGSGQIQDNSRSISVSIDKKG